MADKNPEFKPIIPEEMGRMIVSLSKEVEQLKQNQVEILSSQERMITEQREFFKAVVSLLEMIKGINNVTKAADHSAHDYSAAEGKFSMVEQFGRMCTQSTAARIIGVSVRTVKRMMEDGRLRPIGQRVEVASIYEYLNQSK